MPHNGELLNSKGGGLETQGQKSIIGIHQQLQEALFEEVIAEVDYSQSLVVRLYEIGDLLKLYVQPVHLEIDQEGEVERVHEHLALPLALLLVQEGDSEVEALQQRKLAEEGVEGLLDVLIGSIGGHDYLDDQCPQVGHFDVGEQVEQHLIGQFEEEGELSETGQGSDVALPKHLEEVDGYIQVIEAERLHAVEVVEHSNCGYPVLDRLLRHFLAVSAHEDIERVSEAADLEGIPPLYQYVAANLNHEALPQLRLHQNIGVNDYLIHLSDYYVLQVWKSRVYRRQEEQKVQIGQLSVLKGQLAQRWNHCCCVFHEIFNASAQVDCLDAERAQFSEFLPVDLGEGIHEEIVLSDDQLLETGEVIALDEGVEGVGGYVEANFEYLELPEVHLVEPLHPVGREFG